MNEELIRQCAEEACGPAWYGTKPNIMRGAGEHAIRLYHARAVAPLVEALREITEGAQTTYRARNGRQCSIEADDGELCLIVHSDLIDNGKQALAAFQQEAK